jgi:hypothetical protein
MNIFISAAVMLALAMPCCDSQAKPLVLAPQVARTSALYTVSGVTFRNRCDVLQITATTGREVAKSTSSCSVTLATANFRYRSRLCKNEDLTGRPVSEAAA